MILIEYKLTEDEIYRGVVETSRSRLVTKLLRIFGFVLIGVMLFITTNGLANGTYAFSFTNAFPLLLGIYLVFLSEITAKMQTPNLVKSKNPFSEKVKVRMDQSGFRITGSTFNTHLPWEKFVEIVETKEFFLLKATEGTASVIPKRTLTMEEAIQFRSLVGSVEGPKVNLKFDGVA
jgi:hypothetical protein